ncbi:MAG TPA: hypothetical protein H9915_03505 [Candidatus Gemmiger faecigallinarum]|nr:hypothetical protein [Candidatus Gemmiger faecigallinarum]
MKLWLSRSGRRGGYAARLLLRTAGVVVLAMALTCAAAAAAMAFDWPREPVLLTAVLAITGLAVGIAVGIGRRGAADTLVFCRDDAGRLFVVDARSYAPMKANGRNLVAAARRTQRVLGNLTGGVLQKYMAQPQSLTGLAPQVLAVENRKPSAGGDALVCVVRMPNGAEARQSYWIAGDMDDRDELLRELERLSSLESRVEPRDTRHTGPLLVSAAAAALFGALCAASHPAVAVLDGRLYFPCLGLAFCAVCAVVWFTVKRSRGE